MAKMKTFMVIEVSTNTIQTEYEVEAVDEKDARKRYRSEGQYLGDCTGSGPDRVEIKEVENEKSRR